MLDVFVCVIYSQISPYLIFGQTACSLVSVMFHSTESALLKILSDISVAIDGGPVAVLALLDVAAAFDSVDSLFFCSASKSRLAFLTRFLRGSAHLSPLVCSPFGSALAIRSQFLSVLVSRKALCLVRCCTYYIYSTFIRHTQLTSFH